MTEDARVDAGPDSGAAAHRGFLFSDMRGFTAFAERHGNAAAAEAVGRFLELARAAIARHEGAEIKTEGDAIHAVFPSASSAVMCGLEIVDAAEELNEREPDQRLNLGVGVHAGDAVETAEGYIGSAVNVAARLCAAARPGEVLVSSGVKAETQSTIPVGFIARGRQRLKGIGEPVVVYAVTRDMTARAAVVLPRLGMLLGLSGGIAAALVAIVALGAVLPTTPASGPVVPATPRPVPIGALEIGEYTTTGFEPAFTFKIADVGWTASRDDARLFGLVREDRPAGSIFLARVQEVVENPCVEGGEGSGAPVTDVIERLQDLTHIHLDNVRVTQVGGWPGRQVDVTVDEGALAACGGLVGLEVPLFVAGGEIWRASSGERFRLLSISNGADWVAIMVSLDWEQSRSVSELEELFGLATQVLTDIDF